MPTPKGAKEKLINNKKRDGKMLEQGKGLFIEESMSIFDAMQRMNEVSLKVLFLLRDGRLCAALTDGDIRRWLLSGGDLKEEVRQVANYSPKYLGKNDQKTAFWYMRDNGIEAVPIVDEDMHILDVISWHQTARKTNLNPIDVPVIMMAGGRGSRLFPYTKVLPKPLIPIGEIPISEHIINQFHRQGCVEFYLVVNHKKNMIKAYYNEIEHDYEIHFIDEDEPLGTGGGLSLLKGIIRETCVLTNCDILIREDFSKILQYHKDNENKITMICSAKRFHIPYGVVHIKEGGTIDYMEEKPDISFFTNTGCYILEPSVIEEMEDHIATGFPDVVERCKRAGYNVGIYPISENAWLDMGQMDEMERMREKIEEAHIIM